jgi:hypothetical protein
MQIGYLKPLVVFAVIANISLLIIFTLPIIFVYSLDAFKCFFILSKFQAASSLTIVAVNVCFNFKGQIKPFLCVSILLLEEETTANIINTAKISGIYLDPRIKIGYCVP